MFFNHDNSTKKENVENQEVQQTNEQTATNNNELSICKAELEEWKNKSLRISADFDNYKKRMEKERVFWMHSAQSTLINDILAIVDDFDRASAQAHAMLKPEQQEWMAGFDLIGKALYKMLTKYEVKEITHHTHFDPLYHEAIAQVESPEHQSGAVVQVLQKGFMHKDQVLRPAKVSVAK
jgi:molecular chaperone GrpE